jgi:hypothetical protein
MSGGNDTASTYPTTFHSVGPGKQFPPQFRGKPDNMSRHEEYDDDDDNNDEVDDKSLVLENVPSNTEVDLPHVQPTITMEAPWKVFDAAHFIIKDRREKANLSRTESYHKMIVSSQWTDIVHATISKHTSYHEKVDLYHQTFRMAAMTVIDAIRKQKSIDANAPVQRNKSADCIDPTIDEEVWKRDLPNLFKSSVIKYDEGTAAKELPPTTIGGIRAYCMERSYENKEYTKRKGGKIEILTRPDKIPRFKAQRDVIKQRQPSHVFASQSDIKVLSGKVRKDKSTSLTGTSSKVGMAASNESTLDHPPGSTTKSNLTGTVSATRAILNVAGDIVFDRFTHSSTVLHQNHEPIQSKWQALKFWRGHIQLHNGRYLPSKVHSVTIGCDTITENWMHSTIRMIWNRVCFPCCTTTLFPMRDKSN